MRRALNRSTCLLLASLLVGAAGTAHAQSATMYEGARLIIGDGNLIENSAFVVENGVFVRVGRRGEFQPPVGAARVDLSGKTVMPTLTDVHGHFGFQNIPAGTLGRRGCDGTLPKLL